MKRFLIKSLAALAFLSVVSDAMALPSLRADSKVPLSRMRKVQSPERWSDVIGHNPTIKKAAEHSVDQSDDFQYIYGPDGSIWYATVKYDIETVELEGGYATEDLIKGYTFTIYDSKFNEVGTIHDVIRFEEGEYKCARVMLDVTVTQKFFNLDGRYEAMVAVCMNAPDYSVNTRTLVYSIGGEKEDGCDKVIMTIPGYSIDAIDTSPDPWGENYFISFLTETAPDPEVEYTDYMEYLAEFGQVVTTYKKAGMNPAPTVVHTHEIKNLMLPGDQMSSPMVLSKSVDGRLTLIFSQYEKSFLVDPTGMGGNDEMTPDNSLLIDVYQLHSNTSTEMEHISTTRIEALQDQENPDVYYTFYGIGTFRFDNDVDLEHYTADGKPAFVVTIDKYLLSDDDQYRSSYCVYNADGEKIKTIAEDSYNFTELSDIPGEEPQVMFVYKRDDQMIFEFVDIYSGEAKSTMSQVQDGFVLNGSVDRVPTAGGYHYAMYYANGISDENGDMFALVGWFDKYGLLERVDRINTGQNVQLARVYIDGAALSPYVFNTDRDLEYMVLVKRGSGEENTSDYSLTEELMIVAPGKEAVRTFYPDESKGHLAQVFLFGEQEKMLVISYLDNHKVCADGFELPFTRFQGGDGSETSPYLIATAGDLQQIASCPTSNFRLVSDIDCTGESFNSVHDFSGSLDGAGHSIFNLHLYGSRNTALFASAFKSTFKDINFSYPSMSISGDGDAALLVGTATMCNIDNVKVRGMNVSGDDFSGTFGGIVGHLWSMSGLTRTSLTQSSVVLPKAETIGGVAGELRTGSVVDACVFSGIIEGDNTVGGIVGSTTTGDETISNCRTSAFVKAKHTVGGIVGYLNRTKVTHCFVEGELEAYEPSKWTKALSLGGIAGELHADWEGKSNVPVVYNVVALDQLSYPSLNMSESYPHQCATVHRVVGRTSYNEEPEVSGTNPDGSTAYKDPLLESGICNNIVVSSLPIVDPDFSETSVEGTSVDRNAIDESLLAEYGFGLGDSLEAPWRLTSPGFMKLFFENVLSIHSSAYDVNVEDEFSVLVETIDRPNSGVEFSYPEDMLKLVGSYVMEPEIDGWSTVETTCYNFEAVKPGDAVVTAMLGDEKVECLIRISGTGAVEIIETGVGIKYAEGWIAAPGSSLEIYSLSGSKVMSGRESIDVSCLSAGTYIAVAHTSDGTVKTLKFQR